MTRDELIGVLFTAAGGMDAYAHGAGYDRDLQQAEQYREWARRAQQLPNDFVVELPSIGKLQVVPGDPCPSCGGDIVVDGVIYHGACFIREDGTASYESGGDFEWDDEGPYCMECGARVTLLEPR